MVKKLNHRPKAILQALTTAAPKLSQSQIQQELELLLFPNIWRRWINGNDRLNEKQKALLMHYSGRPNSHQIIYIGPETTAMNLERAVLDAGAKITKSIDRELFYYYIGFGKVDAKGKEIFELGIKARLRKWDEENRSAPGSRSKSTHNLADYDIEDFQHSSSSDSDEDESNEDDDSDESDLSPEGLPTNVDLTTGEASLEPRETEEARKIRKPHKTHKDSVLKAGDHRFKHATPPTKGLKNVLSVKGKTTKATNSPSLSDEIDDEADGYPERIRSKYGEDLEDYDEDEDEVDEDEDEDNDMFGGVGGRDFTQYRGKEDFAFCMGWE